MTTDRPPAVWIEVVVTPRACGDEVLGWAGRALRLRVASGRSGADTAVESLLAEVLDVPRHGVRVIAGRGLRRKLVELGGCDEDRLESRLPGRGGPPYEETGLRHAPRGARAVQAAPVTTPCRPLPRSTHSLRPRR